MTASSALRIDDVVNTLLMEEEGIVYQRVAARVRRLRKARGWSQGELANHAGMIQKTVSNIEKAGRTGDRNIMIRHITALAAAFEVEPWQLMLPDEHGDALLCQKTAKLLHDYGKCSEDERKLIEQMTATLTRKG